MHGIETVAEKSRSLEAAKSRFHWTAKMHKIEGEEIADFLIAKGLAQCCYPERSNASPAPCERRLCARWGKAAAKRSRTQRER